MGWLDLTVPLLCLLLYSPPCCSSQHGAKQISPVKTLLCGEGQSLGDFLQGSLYKYTQVLVLMLHNIIILSIQLHNLFCVQQKCDWISNLLITSEFFWNNRVKIKIHLKLICWYPFWYVFISSDNLIPQILLSAKGHKGPVY